LSSKHTAFKAVLLIPLSCRSISPFDSILCKGNPVYIVWETQDFFCGGCNRLCLLRSSLVLLAASNPSNYKEKNSQIHCIKILD